MRIYSYDQLHERIRHIQTNMGMSGRVNFVENYRGQSQDIYKLENGIGRFDYRKCTLKRKEKKLFKKYIKNVKNGKIDFVQEPYHANRYKFIKEWFYFYQAQHLGIKTRLMDWTMRWEIALMFAVNEERHFGKDGQFWVFICPREYIVNSGNLEKIYNTHPLKIKGSYMINSPFYQDIEGGDYVGERRRTRQHGRFFVQSFDKALIPLEEQDELKQYLHKFIIDGNSKERIRGELGRITTDWAYYRHDDNISQEVNKLNEIITKKYFWE